MKREKIPQMLFEKMGEVGPYPEKVEPVKRMLDITAFFPGGRGLWLEEESEDLPNILVIGQDFSNVKTYEDMIKGLKTDLQSQTWINLRILFKEAGVDLNKCFFSNVFMGLRISDKMTGKFPGLKDKDFVNRNVEFLSFQIETIKPRVIIALGLPASEMLSKSSKYGLDCWENGGALRNHNNGLKFDIQFENHSCKCVALEHPSFRDINVKRRVYGEYKENEAEVQMLKEVVENI